jgi:hypothetical protein
MWAAICNVFGSWVLFWLLFAMFRALHLHLGCYLKYFGLLCFIGAAFLQLHFDLACYLQCFELSILSWASICIVFEPSSSLGLIFTIFWLLGLDLGCHLQCFAMFWDRHQLGCYLQCSCILIWIWADICNVFVSSCPSSFGLLFAMCLAPGLYFGCYSQCFELSIFIWDAI